MHVNQNPGQLAKAVVKTMQIIHLALLMGMILFAVITFTLTPVSKFNYQDTGDMYIFVVPVFDLAMFAVSRFLFKQQLSGAASADNLNSKLVRYQSALIIQLAPLEGAALFGIVVYFISSNLLYLFISGLLILYFILQRPTVQKIKKDLNLNLEDETELE